MPVTCPHCSTRYVLPRALLGPGGARVRCPRCREPFAVSAEGEAVAPAPKAAANGAATGEGAKHPVDGAAASAAPVNGAPPSEPAHAGPPRLEVKVPEKEGMPAVAAESIAVGEPVVVGATPAAIAVGEPVAVATTPTPAPAVLETPLTVARAVLDELAQHSGDAILASRDAGSLFREFGPVIAEAFEFYRRQVGPGADAAPFRAALREKWGVDLDPAHPAGRLG